MGASALGRPQHAVGQHSSRRVSGFHTAHNSDLTALRRRNTPPHTTWAQLQPTQRCENMDIRTNHSARATPSGRPSVLSPTRPRLALTLLAGCAIAISACGSSSSNTPLATTSSSYNADVKTAQCMRSHAASQTFPTRPPPSPGRSAHTSAPTSPESPDHSPTGQQRLAGPGGA